MTWKEITLYIEMAGHLKIKQETFDGVVKENVVDLEMPFDEAVEEAVQQFKSQGVDLHGIVTHPSIVREKDSVRVVHPVIEALDVLKDLLSKETKDERQKASEQLQIVCNECNIDYAHRHLASTLNGMSILLSWWRREAVGSDLRPKVLETLASFVSGQPDLFTSETLVQLCTALQEGISSSECIHLLRLMQLASINHELNRQLLVDKGAIALVMDALAAHHSDVNVVVQACGVLRAFTLDDDMRIEFGKAHEHAKLIVTEHSGLKVLADLLHEHVESVHASGEILVTLGRLAVRNEFCKELVDIGVVREMQQVLQKNMHAQSLVRNILVLMKAVAGNDEVKAEVVKSGGVFLVVEAMNRHLQHPSTQEAGCATLAALALRCPSHCPIIVEAGGAVSLVRAMERHPNSIAVQTQACMAVRNLVSRCRDLCPTFLELGVEPLIQSARAAHKAIEDEAKAALRDLGCQVELRELWTGQKGHLEK